MKFVKIFIIALATILEMSIANAEPEKTRQFTREIANEVVLYAMMASNAYIDDPDKTRFPVENLGWKRVDLKGNKVDTDKNSYTSKTFIGSIFSNLQFDIWEDTKSDKTIFAFKGTDGEIDWITGNLGLGVAIPYKSAKKHVREYMESHPHKKVSVTGHSLGGGLALSVSFWQGVDAVVFNTSPRIFDGMFNSKEDAARLSVFQNGDILQKARNWHPTFLKKIKPHQIVETTFVYPLGNLHSSDLLAEGLLACSTEPKLQEISRQIQPSIACNLE